MVVTDLADVARLGASLVRLDVLGFHRGFSFNPCRIADLGP
jgi:hypothetical protein